MYREGDPTSSSSAPSYSPVEFDGEGVDWKNRIIGAGPTGIQLPPGPALRVVNVTADEPDGPRDTAGGPQAEQVYTTQGGGPGAAGPPVYTAAPENGAGQQGPGLGTLLVGGLLLLALFKGGK